MPIILPPPVCSDVFGEGHVLGRVMSCTILFHTLFLIIFLMRAVSLTCHNCLDCICISFLFYFIIYLCIILYLLYIELVFISFNYLSVALDVYAKNYIKGCRCMV